MKKYFYKIRNNETGLFWATGGRWVKDGKSYSNKGPLKLALRQLVEYKSDLPTAMKLYSIVVFETSETEQLQLTDIADAVGDTRRDCKMVFKW